MSVSPVMGMYRASVANNVDPLNETRVTLRIPQILGTADSAWAVPASPTNTIPPVGSTVWVQFSGGDITKPVYSPFGIKDVQDKVSASIDTTPPKQPTLLTLSTVQYTDPDGIVRANVTASWTAPTQNVDGTNLTDLDHYVIQTSYDNATWAGGLITHDTTVVINGLHTGVNLWVRVQAVDNISNASLWTVAQIITASSSSPPPVPSTPTVTGVLGGLNVVWDGNDNTGIPMPAVFDHVQVQRDTSAAFTAPVTIATMRGADFTYDSVQNYANAYYYRFIAYSKTGVASAASGSASATPKQAGTSDIAANSVTANQMATGTITAQSGVIASIDASKITVGQLQGQTITGGTITGTTISGGTVTGSTVQTGTTGARLVMNPGDGTNTHPPTLQMYSGTSQETSPGLMNTTAGNITTLSSATVNIQSPSVNSGSVASITINSAIGTAPSAVSISGNDTNAPLLYVGGSNQDIEMTVFSSSQFQKYKVTSYGITADQWQNPSYAADWGGATSFSGTANCASLGFRRDAEDNCWMEGAFTVTTSGAGATVFTLPAGYFQSGEVHCFPVMEKQASGQFQTGAGYVGTTGNFHIDAGMGFTRNVGDTFYVNAKIPCGHLI